MSAFIPCMRVAGRQLHPLHCLTHIVPHPHPHPRPHLLHAGKTLIARAVAAQTNATFLKLAGPQLVQVRKCKVLSKV